MLSSTDLLKRVQTCSSALEVTKQQEQQLQQQVSTVEQTMSIYSSSYRKQNEHNGKYITFHTIVWSYSWKGCSELSISQAILKQELAAFIIQVPLQKQNDWPFQDGEEPFQPIAEENFQA